MTDDDPGHCAICKRSFIDTDAEEDGAITLCPHCDRVSHVVCDEAHACPCQGPSDEAMLAAWELACADGRK